MNRQETTKLYLMAYKKADDKKYGIAGKPGTIWNFGYKYIVPDYEDELKAPAPTAADKEARRKAMAAEKVEADNRASAAESYKAWLASYRQRDARAAAATEEKRRWEAVKKQRVIDEKARATAKVRAERRAGAERDRARLMEDPRMRKEMERIAASKAARLADMQAELAHNYSPPVTQMDKDVRRVAMNKDTDSGKPGTITTQKNAPVTTPDTEGKGMSFGRGLLYGGVGLVGIGGTAMLIKLLMDRRKRQKKQADISAMLPTRA